MSNPYRCNVDMSDFCPKMSPNGLLGNVARALLTEPYWLKGQPRVTNLKNIACLETGSALAESALI